jgi:hypothetical protein
MNRICSETIFVTTEHDATHGIGVNKKGQVLSINAVEQTDIPYILSMLNHTPLSLKFCEPHDPRVADIAYTKGLYNDELGAITSENSMFKSRRTTSSSAISLISGLFFVCPPAPLAQQRPVFVAPILVARTPQSSRLGDLSIWFAKSISVNRSIQGMDSHCPTILPLFVCPSTVLLSPSDLSFCQRVHLRAVYLASDT